MPQLEDWQKTHPRQMIRLVFAVPSAGPPTVEEGGVDLDEELQDHAGPAVHAHIFCSHAPLQDEDSLVSWCATLVLARVGKCAGLTHARSLLWSDSRQVHSPARGRQIQGGGLHCALHELLVERACWTSKSPLRIKVTGLAPNVGDQGLILPWEKGRGMS